MSLAPLRQDLLFRRCSPIVRRAIIACCVLLSHGRNLGRTLPGVIPGQRASYLTGAAAFLLSLVIQDDVAYEQSAAQMR